MKVHYHFMLVFGHFMQEVLCLDWLLFGFVTNWPLYMINNLMFFNLIFNRILFLRINSVLDELREICLIWKFNIISEWLLVINNALQRVRDRNQEDESISVNVENLTWVIQLYILTLRRNIMVILLKMWFVIINLISSKWLKIRRTLGYWKNY